MSTSCDQFKIYFSPFFYLKCPEEIKLAHNVHEKRSSSGIYAYLCVSEMQFLLFNSQLSCELFLSAGGESLPLIKFCSCKSFSLLLEVTFAKHLHEMLHQSLQYILTTCNCSSKILLIRDKVMIQKFKTPKFKGMCGQDVNQAQKLNPSTAFYAVLIVLCVRVCLFPTCALRKDRQQSREVDRKIHDQHRDQRRA